MPKLEYVCYKAFSVVCSSEFGGWDQLVYA